jgi:regulator of extracellular matrix RemA (YlzA/DUF370 family)
VLYRYALTVLHLGNVFIMKTSIFDGNSCNLTALFCIIIWTLFCVRHVLDRWLCTPSCVAFARSSCDAVSSLVHWYCSRNGCYVLPSCKIQVILSTIQPSCKVQVILSTIQPSCKVQVILSTIQPSCLFGRLAIANTLAMFSLKF